jgi:sortase A
VQNGQNQAAADVVRSQLDAIYKSDPHHSTQVQQQQPTPEPTASPAPDVRPSEIKSTIEAGPGAVNMQAANQQSTAESPYDRTHEEESHTTTESSWKDYHSAWQSYYQQYYERYYVGRVHEVKKNLEAESHVAPAKDEPLSTNEAMYDLRSKLRNQINERAQKVRKSRHFIPIMAGVFVMFVFLFLQYNRTVFAAVDAYVTPSTLDPSNLIVDPSSVSITADPRLIIPKIGVDVPIVWDANAASQDSLNAAMDNGVAWFNIKGANARPGERGNFVVSGHSSNDWLDQGDYKFIFARLEQLGEGDAVYVNYNGTRYTYTVTSTKVVKPTDVSSLMTGTDKPHMTLITCTPLGTALNRLLVFADQVSPDPNEASAQTNSESSSSDASKMPSNSPTFFERIFGTGNSN